MRKMTTLGGYEIVDEKAREDINIVAEKADEALSLAKGATKAFVYDTYSDMIAELNALDKAELLVNFHVMIRTVCVPDLWISGVSDEHVEYSYTSNEDFIVDLTEDGVVQVGYFVLSALETQKVDLSEYVKNTDYATGSTPGIVRPTLGLTVGNNGMFYIAKAAKSQINAKTNGYNPITPELLDYAVKKALSDCKLTGDDVWTEEEKAKALELLGGVKSTDVSIDGFALTIVKRDGSGRIYCHDPKYDNHATTKKYVDDLVGSVETILTELHTHAESLIGGEA